MTMMTQCRLERPDARGVEVQIAWIEAAMARKGKVVKIKTENGWDDGWTVAKTGSTMDAKTVQERERDFKKHRIATDV